MKLDVFLLTEQWTVKCAGYLYIFFLVFIVSHNHIYRFFIRLFHLFMFLLFHHIQVEAVTRKTPRERELKGRAKSNANTQEHIVKWFKVIHALNCLQWHGFSLPQLNNFAIDLLWFRCSQIHGFISMRMQSAFFIFPLFYCYNNIFVIFLHSLFIINDIFYCFLRSKLEKLKEHTKLAFCIAIFLNLEVFHTFTHIFCFFSCVLNENFINITCLLVVAWENGWESRKVVKFLSYFLKYSSFAPYSLQFEILCCCFTPIRSLVLQFRSYLQSFAPTCIVLLL